MSRAPLQRFHTWAICPCCNGNGTAENPVFSNGFTSEEWAELSADRDDQDGTSAADRYLAGAYDVPCKECDASGKIQVPDIASMPFAERRVFAARRREERLASVYAAESAAEHAAERRMGC